LCCNRVTLGTVTRLPTYGKGVCKVTTAAVQTGDTQPRRDRILDIVVELLESEGYDAVQLREVARRARTSLATIYKRYGTRDELILAALECWMAENRYAGLAAQTHRADESLYDGLMRVLRTIFEPWEQHPGMLKAYFRARSAPGGQRLLRRGLDAVVPAGMEVLADVDTRLVQDLDNILSSLVYGLLGRFAAEEIEITEILPTLDRAVHRLTSGYESAGAKS
jgi:TetR/AcrR family transcriptional regulator, cholesterol catabolism regulator